MRLPNAVACLTPKIVCYCNKHSFLCNSIRISLWSPGAEASFKCNERNILSWVKVRVPSLHHMTSVPQTHRSKSLRWCVVILRWTPTLLWSLRHAFETILVYNYMTTRTLLYCDVKFFRYWQVQMYPVFYCRLHGPLHSFPMEKLSGTRSACLIHTSRTPICPYSTVLSPAFCPTPTTASPSSPAQEVEAMQEDALRAFQRWLLHYPQSHKACHPCLW